MNKNYYLAPIHATLSPPTQCIDKTEPFVHVTTKFHLVTHMYCVNTKVYGTPSEVCRELH